MHNAEKPNPPASVRDTGGQGGLWASSNTRARNSLRAVARHRAPSGGSSWGSVSDDYCLPAEQSLNKPLYLPGERASHATEDPLHRRRGRLAGPQDRLPGRAPADPPLGDRPGRLQRRERRRRLGADDPLPRGAGRGRGRRHDDGRPRLSQGRDLPGLRADRPRPPAGEFPDRSPGAGARPGRRPATGRPSPSSPSWAGPT